MLTGRELLDIDFIPLNGADSVGNVLHRMDEQEVYALPVIDSTTAKLVGQVTYDQLKGSNHGSVIADLDLQRVIKVYKDQHIFEVARLMLQYELCHLPVVDKERTFLGVIEKQQVYALLCKMLNLDTKGSIITILLDRIDLSLSEIVHLIETEDAKILGLAVKAPDENRQKYEVSIKLNLKNISRVTAALRRYGYSVLTDSTNQVFGNDLENKADELLKYIDM